MSASRCAPCFAKVRPSRLSPAQANGLRYENRVHKALAVLAKTLGANVEQNPWFRFTDQNGAGACSPDSILWLDQELAIVIEVKYTWVPTASTKLRGLYLPIVDKVLKPVILRSLVICKNLTPESPRPIDGIRDGTQCSVAQAPVYQWLGQGPIRW